MHFFAVPRFAWLRLALPCFPLLCISVLCFALPCCVSVRFALPCFGFALFRLDLRRSGYIVALQLAMGYLSVLPAADSAARAQTKRRLSRGVALATALGSDSRRSEGKNTTVRIRPPWKEPYTEQVVLLDWPLLTTKIVQDVSQHVLINAAAEAQKRLQQQLLNGGSIIGDRGVSGGAGAKSGIGSGPVGPSGPTAAEEAAVDNLRFLPQEIEGQFFFEGQAVAVLPVYPMQVHPLMDDTIFKIMLSVPTLQVVLVLPDSFFSHTRDLRHRMSWARKLVRRLWDRGGDVHQRIRLLPAPLDDTRLLQLLRQADMLLDPFPFGSSFQTLALALSVGTPVVAMQNGVELKTPQKVIQPD